MGWEIAFAWLLAGSCSLLAARLRRGLARLVPPAPALLLSQLLSEVGASDARLEVDQRAAIAELNQRLSDVSFELGALPARFTALTRICLAGGTAVALFAYIRDSDRPTFERLLGLVACAAGGLLGAASVLSLGRLAKRRSTAIREAWDRSSRETGKSLGTSLEPAKVESVRLRGRERA